MKLLLLVAAVVFFVQAASATYVCEIYNRNELYPTCAATNPSAYAYYDPNVTTIEAEIARTNSFVTGVVAFAATSNLLDETCTGYLSIWFCQNPGLGVTTTNVPLLNCPVNDNFQPPATPAPVPTCLDMCLRFVGSCAPQFQAAGPGFAQLIPPNFCDSYTNNGVTADGVVYPCWNVTPSNLTYYEFNCPDYSVNVSNECKPACPSPEYSRDDVFDLGLMQQIVGWISFVVAAVLGLAFVLVPRLRAFPSRIVLFLLISSMVLSLAFMLATFVGGNVGDVWCGDVEAYSVAKLDTDNRAINNRGLCVFQGWNIVLGTLLLGHWWAVLAVNTAWIVYRGLNVMSIEHGAVQEAIYHAVGWGLPLVYSIIAAAATKIDYEPQSAYCFIASSQNNAWQIALWFVPMGLCLAVGTVASLAAILMLNSRWRDGSFNKKYLPATLRILICLLFFFATITLIFAAQIYATDQQSTTAVGIVSYIVCGLSNIDEPECRRRLETTTNVTTVYDLAMASTFFMAASGFFLCLFFGTTRQVRSAATTQTHRSTVSAYSQSPTRSEA